MPSSHTLIATLGRSPGAVTGLYNALVKYEKTPIDTLHIVRTKHPAVRSAYNLVCSWLRDTGRSVQIIDHRLPEPDLTDYALKPETLQKIIVDVLDTCIHQEPKTHLIMGVAGGRSSMGAMLAAAAQLYSEDVAALYHLWVVADLEKYGDIDTLDDIPRGGSDSLYWRVLYPPEDKCRLVALPVYNLSQQCQEVKKHSTLALQAQPVIDEGTTDAMLRTLPRRLNFEQAARFISLETENPAAHLSEIAKVLLDAGLIDIDKYIDQLARFGGAGDLKGWVEEITEEMPNDMGRYYWARGLDKVYAKQKEALDAQPDALQAGLMLLERFLKIK